MPRASSAPSRRGFLAASAAAGPSGQMPQALRVAAAIGAIRLFRVDVPEKAIGSRR